MRREKIKIEEYALKLENLEGLYFFFEESYIYVKRKEKRIDGRKNVMVN